MKKIFVLLSLILFLNGCAESVAILGTSVGGASSGKMTQTSLNSAVSYGIKKKTGKTPFGHALARAKENNKKKKNSDRCKFFVNKTNLKFAQF